MLRKSPLQSPAHEPRPGETSTPAAKRRWRMRHTVAVTIGVCALALFFGGFVPLCACGGKDDSQGQEGPSRPRRVDGATTATEKANENKSAEVSKIENNVTLPPFYRALEKALALRNMTTSSVCDTSDAVARRVLEDYGAMFLASETVQPPPSCVFKTEVEVANFQSKAGFSTEKIGGSTIELQPAAMRALLEARQEAIKEGLNITPRGGAEAARRNYEDTRRLWDTRFLPALVHWQQKGRLTKDEAARLRALPLDKQVGEVLGLEEKGIFFSKDLSKSILYSIAAPGTSQHIAMLALDVSQFAQTRVRRILARHGWFQTVKSDLPHFTYLGVTEESLPTLGLHPVISSGQEFWIPNVER